jgi:hypothetical protein
MSWNVVCDLPRTHVLWFGIPEKKNPEW